MIIDASLRHSVVFLCQRADNYESIKPMATAFLVAINIENNYLASYIATARHNLEYASKKYPLFIRINTVNKKCKDIEIKIEDFEQHHISDVAICPIKLEKGIFGSFVPYGMLLRKEMLDRRPLVEGSSVNIPSLFSQFYGKEIMHPIVRTGSLALIPEEKIFAQIGPNSFNEVEGYLVECLSWGGCSGSPVFVDYFDPKATSKDPYEVGTVRLLGLISSHFDIMRPVENYNYDDSLLVPNNSGIAIVMPAQAIVDLLNLEEIKNQRNQAYKQYMNERSD